MQKDLPQLRGLIDARVDAEINRAFENLYRYIDEKIKSAEGNAKDSSIAEIRRQVDLFASRLATPIIEPSGTELATIQQERTLEVADIPNLPANKITSGTIPLARLAATVLKTDDGLLEDIVGAPNVNTGKVIIKDNNGNSIKVMTCA